MDLARDVLLGLQALGDPKQIADAPFKELTETAFLILLQKATEEKLLESPSFKKVDPILLKHTYGALITLILEACKINFDPEQLKDTLAEEKVDAKRIEMITTAYSKSRASIRSSLATNTFSFPHIVDVDWRLDYCIKSSTLERMDNSVYLISLNTKQSQQLKETEEKKR